MMRIEEARATTWPLLNGDDPETASRLYSNLVAASLIVGELAAKDGVAVGLS